MEIDWSLVSGRPHLIEAFVPLPDDGELRLVLCQSTGNWRIYDQGSESSLPEDAGGGGQGLLLRAAESIVRSKLAEWERVANELAALARQQELTHA